MLLKELWRSRKGFNDMWILLGVLSFFFGVVFVVALVNDSFSEDNYVVDASGFVDVVDGSTSSTSTLEAVTDVVFWDFSGNLGLPDWLQWLFLLLKLTVLILIAKFIWPGGGS